MKRSGKIKVCPRCGSPLYPLSEIVSGASTNYYYCKRCGYKGALYIEISYEPSSNAQ
ncbi:MAG: hypothetical protein ACP5SE_02430 [Nitrososphaeria archaeon]